MRSTLLYGMAGSIVLVVLGGVIGWLLHKPPEIKSIPVIARIDTAQIVQQWVRPLIDSTKRLNELIAEMSSVKDWGDPIQWTYVPHENPIVPIYIADSTVEITVPINYYDRDSDTLISRDTTTTTIRTEVAFAGDPLNMFKAIRTTMGELEIPVYTQFVPVIHNVSDYPFLSVTTSLGITSGRPYLGVGVMVKDFGGEIGYTVLGGVTYKASKSWRLF